MYALPDDLALDSLMASLATSLRDGVEISREVAQAALDACRTYASERRKKMQLRSELISVIGHDLRAPLEAIVIGTEMLAMREHDPAGTQALRRIVSFAQRATVMIDHVVDLTDVRLGHGITLARCPTRMVSLMRSALGSVRLDHPGRRFELIAPEEISGEWDPERVGEVFAYTLGHATRTADDGAPIIATIARGDGVALLRVDYACAIPELIPQFFDRLVPCLAREILRAHGGGISIASSPSGTTFHVVLPTQG